MLYNTDISPIKQSKIKRCNPEWTGYRYTWGDKSEEPLERVGKNMTKVRNKLNSKSIRSKIKQAHLEELDLSTDPCIMEVLVTTLARHKTGGYYMYLYNQSDDKLIRFYRLTFKISTTVDLVILKILAKEYAQINYSSYFTTIFPKQIAAIMIEIAAHSSFEL